MAIGCCAFIFYIVLSWFLGGLLASLLGFSETGVQVGGILGVIVFLSYARWIIYKDEKKK